MQEMQREIVELKMRVERLEEIIRQLGHTPLAPGTATMSQAPSYEAEVRALLAKGNEIGAIQLYRQHTNVSLAEAQMRVQAMKG